MYSPSSFSIILESDIINNKIEISRNQVMATICNQQSNIGWIYIHWHRWQSINCAI